MVRYFIKETATEKNCTSNKSACCDLHEFLNAVFLDIDCDARGNSYNNCNDCSAKDDQIKFAKEIAQSGEGYLTPGRYYNDKGQHHYSCK